MHGLALPGHTSRVLSWPLQFNNTSTDQTLHGLLINLCVRKSEISTLYNMDTQFRARQIDCQAKCGGAGGGVTGQANEDVCGGGQEGGGSQEAEGRARRRGEGRGEGGWWVVGGSRANKRRVLGGGGR